MKFSIKSLHKYWFCVLANVIFALGYIICDQFEKGLLDITFIGTQKLSLYDEYFIIYLPMISVVYGVLAYIFIRKVLLTQLLGFLSGFITLMIYGNITDNDFSWLLQIIILSAIPVVCSVIPMLVTALIYYLIRECKSEKLY